MCTESRALTEALCSAALGHMALDDHSYQLNALEARSAAISALYSDLNSTDDEISFYETSAATSLVLTMSEVCQGDRSTWYSHLNGTKDIITHASYGLLNGTDALKQSTEGQWILRNFAYHDVLASITLGRAPLLAATYLDGITNLVDSCLGVGTEMLKYVALISTIQANIFSTGDLPGEGEITKLDEILRGWEPPAGTSKDLLPVAIAYKCTAQILLYQLEPTNSKQCDFNQARINETLAELIAAISSITQNSIAEGSLVFPLFIAGGEVKTEHDRNLVRRRLQGTLHFRKFRNISQAIDVLEHLWSVQSVSASAKIPPPTWREVLHSVGGGLILT